jgi:hypothetical protein
MRQVLAEAALELLVLGLDSDFFSAGLEESLEELDEDPEDEPDDESDEPVSLEDEGARESVR